MALVISEYRRIGKLPGNLRLWNDRFCNGLLRISILVKNRLVNILWAYSLALVSLALARLDLLDELLLDVHRQLSAIPFLCLPKIFERQNERQISEANKHATDASIHPALSSVSFPTAIITWLRIHFNLISSVIFIFSAFSSSISPWCTHSWKQGHGCKIDTNDFRIA